MSNFQAFGSKAVPLFCAVQEHAGADPGFWWVVPTSQKIWRMTRLLKTAPCFSHINWDIFSDVISKSGPVASGSFGQGQKIKGKTWKGGGGALCRFQFPLQELLLKTERKKLLGVGQTPFGSAPGCVTKAVICRCAQKKPWTLSN